MSALRREPPEQDRCGGSGVIHCYCGGDFCVCANQGEIMCDGCTDCEADEDDWFEDEDDDGSFDLPHPYIDTAQEETRE